MCLTSSTRHAESLTNNSSLATDSPNLDFSPLVHSDLALRGLVDILPNSASAPTTRKKKPATPSQVMHARWSECVKKYMPAFDVSDLPQTQVKGFVYSTNNSGKQLKLGNGTPLVAASNKPEELIKR